MRQRTGDFVVSVSWATPPAICDALAAVSGGPVLRRASDWGASRTGKVRGIVGSTLRALRASRGRPLVLMTAGAEVYVAALACRVLPGRRRQRLVVADFLAPRSRRLPWLQSWLLRRVDGWACIRRGDIEHLHRTFGVRRDRCRFVLFPLSMSMSAAEQAAARSRDGDDEIDLPGLGEHVPRPLVYSAGNAHRDWATVLDAAEHVSATFVLSTDRSHPDLQRSLPQNVVLLDPVTPEVGRQLALASDVVVVALADTHLPSGPLVLVDAMALGKAVVVTQVNGTRDYVRHDETAVVVPAGEAGALAAGIRRVLSDDLLRSRLSENAVRFVEAALTPGDFGRGVADTVSVTTGRR